MWASDAADRPLASWNVRHPLVALLLVGLGGVLLTAVGSAIGAIVGLDKPSATLLTAAFVGASALAGLGIMLATRPSLAEYGLRRAVHLRTVWWAIPLLLAPLLVGVIAGFNPEPRMLLPYLALTVAVGFNEEIWFRGLALAAVRRLGARPTIFGSAAVFGVMHLANALAGATLPALLLQFGFAALVGVVLAELVAITGSMWLPIGWHFAYDFVSFNSGDAFGPHQLAASSLITVMLAIYAVALWRRVPVDRQG